MTDAPGTLSIGEFHPAARNAYRYLASLGPEKLLLWQESFASNSIEGNRPAEICSETLRRFLQGEPVSDRYLLGLAWIIKEGEEND